MENSILGDITKIVESYIYKMSSPGIIKEIERNIISFVYNKYDYKIGVKVDLINDNIDISFTEDLTLLDRKLKINKLRRK